MSLITITHNYGSNGRARVAVQADGAAWQVGGLHGDLGAGKTTLVRGILHALGFAGRVKSPTYTLVEPYHVNGLDLRHFDLYRLHDEDDWEAAGFRDEFDSHNIFFIEWPEKAQKFIPGADLKVSLEILPQGRRIIIQGNTPMGRECLTQL